MTREEARKLLSGYATGSLTELEQQLLFDAALEDQELFDELAAEQEVKELVELPGARRRLLEALGPERKEVVWWPWAAGVAAAAAIAVGVWVSRPPTAEEAPVQVARVDAPAAPPITAAQNEPQAAQANELVAEARPTPAPATADSIAVPAPTPPAPPAPPPAAARAEKAVTMLDNVARPKEETAAVQSQLEARTKELPILAIDAANGKDAASAKGKAAFPATQAFTAAAPVAAPPVGGALNYEVRNTGILRMTPTRSGVLSVTFDGRPLYPETPVVAGTTIDVSIPLEAKQLRIDYAAAPNAPNAAAQNGEISGTLTLPEAANPRAVIVIPAQR